MAGMTMRALLMAALLAPGAVPGVAQQMPQQMPRGEPPEHVQPLDCASALRSHEKVICASEELKKLDARVAELDNELLALLPKDDAMAQRDLHNSRHRFVDFRRMCSMDIACQKRAHEHRLKWLRKQIARWRQAQAAQDR